LRSAVVSSRAQTLQATFADGRAILLAGQRNRVRLGRPLLNESALAVALARILAQARVETAVYSSSLRLLASAGPGTATGPAVLTGITLPPPPRNDLLAAAQDDTITGPLLVNGAGSGDLLMVLPLTGRQGTHLGAVVLAQPAGPIQSELRSAATVVAAGSAAVLLVALLTGLMLTARVLGPLRKLTAAAQALGRGDLSRRSGLPPRRDEVGELARVFDEMADSVERTVRVREDAERRMRQFIGDASHELRTPLTAIKGYLDVLPRGAGASPEVVQAALPVMSHEAERMRALVTDLLALARADEGRALRPRPVELDSFLEQFLAAHQSEAPVSISAARGRWHLPTPRP
jgi:HAMP domain-containing protein